MTYARNYRGSKGRRSPYTKSGGRAATNYKIAVRKPTAATQKAQILSLNRKVNVLKRRQSNITERVFYQKSWDATVSANYAVHPLVTPTTWHNVFGQSDNVIESRKMNLKSLFLDFTLSPHNEHSEIDYTIFLLTPANNQVMRETSSMNAFNSNGGQTDYTWNDGIVFMNPKRFHIHKTWRCKTNSQITATGVPAHPSSASAIRTVRRTFSMPFKKQLRNSTGVWTAIGDDEIPVSSALTIVAFNNNSAVDLENPNWKGVAHWTCYC